MRHNPWPALAGKRTSLAESRRRRWASQVLDMLLKIAARGYSLLPDLPREAGDAGPRLLDHNS